VTDYDWDAAAGLPVVLQERTREIHCKRPPTTCQNVPWDPFAKPASPTEPAKTTYVYGLDLISASAELGYNPGVILNGAIDDNPLSNSVSYISRSRDPISDSRDPIAVNDVIVINAEKMKVTAVESNVLTVNRAVDGTTAASHTLGTDILKGSTERYYFVDGLGSTTMTVQPLAGGGAETKSYQYEVFGGLRSGSAAGESMLFTGEEYDAKARKGVPSATEGLYYLRARYYDPSIGRFLSQDPLPGTALSPQLQDPYPYVANNPVNGVDPRGLLSERANMDLSDELFTSIGCAGAFESLAVGTLFFAVGATTYSPVLVGIGWLSIGLGLVAYYQDCADMYRAPSR